MRPEARPASWGATPETAAIPPERTPSPYRPPPAPTAEGRRRRSCRRRKPREQDQTQQPARVIPTTRSGFARSASRPARRASTRRRSRVSSAGTPAPRAAASSRAPAGGTARGRTTSRMSQPRAGTRRRCGPQRPRRQDADGINGAWANRPSMHERGEQHDARRHERERRDRAPAGDVGADDPEHEHRQPERCGDRAPEIEVPPPLGTARNDVALGENGGDQPIGR